MQIFIYDAISIKSYFKFSPNQVLTRTSQLNKYLSTNSDTCTRVMHTRTADNCGVGKVSAACSACSGCVNGASS